jgi:hypothetical protein
MMHGERLDVVQLTPAAVKTVGLETDNPGTWLFHDHVNDHVLAGMITSFTITPSGRPAARPAVAPGTTLPFTGLSRWMRPGSTTNMITGGSCESRVLRGAWAHTARWEK